MHELKFTTDMLLDADGGRGIRRIRRIARSTTGYQEIQARLQKVIEMWNQHGAAAWNEDLRLIFPATELGELCLILLCRYGAIANEDSTIPDDAGE